MESIFSSTAIPISINKWKPPTCRITFSQFQSHVLAKNQKPPASKRQLELKSERDAKAVFILGATGTGKSKLAVDLATNIGAEIINSDKIQVYNGLGILTNIIKEDEQKGIPHHLLGFLDPDADFTVHDFCTHALKAMDKIIKENGRVPIIVGCSNSYTKELVENPSYNFHDKFETLFLWLDVDVNVLYKKVEKRVDEMVEEGLLEEVRDLVTPGSDHTRGVWRVIGVQEMDLFLYAEKTNADEMTRKMLLERAIAKMKENTCRLVDVHLEKIRGLADHFGWKLHRIDATCAVDVNSGVDSEKAWNEIVLKPSLGIVNNFLELD